MLKVRGLALTTILLLGCAACTNQKETVTTTTTTAPTATPTAAVSPPASPTTPTPATPTAPTTATVKGSNFKWQDDVSGTPITTIKVGGTVTWTITQGGGVHKLAKVPAGNGCAELDASFNSGNFSAGQSVSKPFNTAGTFGYKCGIHGGTPNCNDTSAGQGMWGIIKVVP